MRWENKRKTEKKKKVLKNKHHSILPRCFTVTSQEGSGRFCSDDQIALNGCLLAFLNERKLGEVIQNLGLATFSCPIFNIVIFLCGLKLFFVGLGLVFFQALLNQ